MVRRAVALVGGVLVLVILIFAIHSCQVSSKKRTLKEYNLNVGSLVQESDGQISKDLFRQLSTGGSAIDKQTQLNQYRIQSDDLLRRASKLDVPGEMEPAQRQLLQVFEYRRDGIANIAAKLPTALGRQGSAAATTSIAAQMQQFLTSDVIYSQRVIPFIKQALDSAGVGGQRIQPSQFFPSLEWLSPATVASRLNSAAPAAAAARSRPGRTASASWASASALSRSSPGWPTGSRPRRASPSTSSSATRARTTRSTSRSA